MKLTVCGCGGKNVQLLKEERFLIATYESLESAERAAALWNAAEEKNLKTDDIKAGIIQHALDGLEIAKGIIDACHAHEEKQDKKIKRLAAEKVVMLEALEAAKQFIYNGIELGYIYLPEEGDSALETPALIEAAIRKARGEE